MKIDAWLVTDSRSELIAAIRRLARAHGLVPGAGPFCGRGVTTTGRAVVHTSHATCGYRIRAAGLTVVWAPEFLEFPRWAREADLMFAEAAAWSRPIRFAGGAGGHLDVHAVARAARRHGVTRLVFAHIGRPTLRALDRGLTPPHLRRPPSLVLARSGSGLAAGLDGGSVRPIAQNIAGEV